MSDRPSKLFVSIAILGGILAVSTASIFIRFAQREAPSLVVAADPGRLRQVFANLLGNAAQAGASHIEISRESARGFAVITVHDDGPGIDAGIRERLFDPFATGRKDGTGLGLAICRRIAEAHGGDLQALPGEGTGSTFRMRFPMAGE